MIKKLRLKVIFIVFFILMIAVWIWGSFLFQNLLVWIFGKAWFEDGKSSLLLIAVNFVFLAVSILIFTVLFFRQLDKTEKIKEQAEKERLMLFANMAHDLKTPISSILGYSKTLALGIVTDETKKIEYLNTISSKAERMNDLIDRLFEYVKLESPENILHKTNVDVAELLRKSVGNVYTDFEEAGISLEAEIPENQIFKEVDPLEIDRVFTNLLNNARKHNPKGTAVSVFMSEKGKVTVADNGNSLPSEVVAHLFKPFISGDESRMSKNGSGLGLALAYKIMKKHGGKLSLVSPCICNQTEFTKAFVAEF